MFYLIKLCCEYVTPIVSNPDNAHCVLLNSSLWLNNAILTAVLQSYYVTIGKAYKGRKQYDQIKSATELDRIFKNSFQSLTLLDLLDQRILFSKYIIH